MTTADVVVIGLGAWGSQALWRLAVRGVDVLGLEQHGIGHALGSTHGTTRLFRVACMEHPGLAPIALRARDLWYELGDRTGQVLLRQTGGMMVGPSSGRVVAGTLTAAKAADLDVAVLDRAELIARLPAYADVAEDDLGVWDPAAGITYPEAGVRAAVAAAQAAGARVRTGTRVTAIESDDAGVTVMTGDEVIRAQQVVLSAGPWMPHFTGLPLVARRIPMFWFTGPDPADTRPDGRFDLDAFPVFIRKLADGNVLWGHGARQTAAEDYAVKIGLEDRDGLIHHPTDADAVDRTVHPEDHRLLSQTVGRAFPGLVNTPARSVICMITVSPDGQFLLGRPGGDPRLVIATGDSGHGFKHAPALGELLAQLATGEDPFTDIAFLDPTRPFPRTADDA